MQCRQLQAQQLSLTLFDNVWSFMHIVMHRTVLWKSIQLSPSAVTVATDQHQCSFLSCCCASHFEWHQHELSCVVLRLRLAHDHVLEQPCRTGCTDMSCSCIKLTLDVCFRAALASDVRQCCWSCIASAYAHCPAMQCQTPSVLSSNICDLHID